MNFSAIRHNPLVGNLLEIPFRLIPKTAQVRIVQGPLRGKKWIVGSGIHGLWLGSYEYEKQHRFRAAVHSGDVVYDLGANVGYYTLLACVLTGPSGKVYSFEPAERNLGFLQKHLSLNRIANCSVLPAAVGSIDGVAEFDTGRGPAMGRLAQIPSGTLVRTAALDTLVFSGQILPPNVIKCDIEGGEYDALLGARKTIERYRPTIFLATHGDEVKGRCCRLLSEIRYDLSPLDRASMDEASEILATAGPLPERERAAA